MGRSISYPAGAQVCFTVLEPEDEDQDAFERKLLAIRKQTKIRMHMTGNMNAW